MHSEGKYSHFCLLNPHCLRQFAGFYHDPEQTFGTKGLREKKQTRDDLLRYTEESQKNSSVNQEVVIMFIQYG
ncbi:MAG TPA: hypothetical protein VEU97_13480, partial [Ktedonobacteraceae bacterium]|nr:hypothetical protein [Ktedonobacteraceae bacterium]